MDFEKDVLIRKGWEAKAIYYVVTLQRFALSDCLLVTDVATWQIIRTTHIKQFRTGQMSTQY